MIKIYGLIEKIKESVLDIGGAFLLTPAVLAIASPVIFFVKHILG